MDARAVAMSRRPGFAKTRLAANLAKAGIEYLHAVASRFSASKPIPGIVTAVWSSMR